jgi:hypothetical protein
MMRRTWPVALLLALGGCSDGTGPTTGDPEAEIGRLAGLSQAAGREGDYERATALNTAIAALRAGRTLTKIVVSEGGLPREYVGVVLEIEAPSQVGAPDPELPAVRSLIAWSGDGAKQVLQVSAFGDSVDFDLFAPIEPPPEEPGVIVHVYPLSFGIATLRRRGTRDALWAAGGFAVVRRTSLDGPCAAMPAGAATCDRASFTLRFKAQLTRIPIFTVFPSDPPPTVLTIEAETQSVRGARIEPSCPPRGCFVPGSPLFPTLP